MLEERRTPVPDVVIDQLDALGDVFEGALLALAAHSAIASRLIRSAARPWVVSSFTSTSQPRAAADRGSARSDRERCGRDRSRRGSRHRSQAPRRPSLPSRTHGRCARRGAPRFARSVRRLRTSSRVMDDILPDPTTETPVEASVYPDASSHQPWTTDRTHARARLRPSFRLGEAGVFKWTSRTLACRPRQERVGRVGRVPQLL